MHNRPDIVHSVIILPRLPDGSVLLQLRDNQPGIVYPGTIGLFGGSVEAGETAAAAACRETTEELSLSLRPKEFKFLFDITLIIEEGLPIKRSVFGVNVEDVKNLTLREGQAIVVLKPKEALPANVNPPAIRILTEYRSLG